MRYSVEEKQVLFTLNDGDWHKDQELIGRTGISSVGLRLLANRSNKLISKAGPCGGYKLASKADEEELLHAYNDLRSRAREINKRAAALHDRYLT